MSKSAVVCGGGGFIGHHLTQRLKQEGYWVRAVDLKHPEFSQTVADEFTVADLREMKVAQKTVVGMDEVYQLAADMGGMGFISGENDADIMYNSAMINLNVAHASILEPGKKVFFSSSACIYPLRNQLDPDNPKCAEDTAYPADPDTEYGWEKLFSERLYLAYAKNRGLDVRIARFHNVFGPEGTWTGGREKAPAALCRKVAEAEDGGDIKVWGKGDQTRSFLYIDECLEGIRRLMESDVREPLNIGSEEMITINDMAELIMKIAGKKLRIKNVPGPEGVRGRTSDNTFIKEKLGWSPSGKLEDGLRQTYAWIAEQVRLHEQERVAY